MNIFQNVASGSQLFPHRGAVAFEGQRLTYSDIERLSAHAGAILHDAGVRCGDRIGLIVPNVPAFPVWYYAGLRLGCVIVTVNTRLAPEEMGFILSDGGARVLIATDAFAEHVAADVPDCVQQVVRVAEDALTCEGSRLAEGAALPAGHFVDMRPEDPATILYTSGTTGFPKGATLSHGNVRATMHAHNHLNEMRPDDRILLAVPLFHCYGQNSLLNAGLNVGATMILQRRFDLNESLRLIKAHRVTKLFAVPTTFQLLHDFCEPEDLSSVGYCFSAAAKLPLQLGQQWREKFGMPIYEGYGLTETAPFASYNHRLKHVPGSIGAPVDLVEMKIVDPETGQTCAPGTPGEIVIRGPNVMLGYWNRPEETAAAIREGWFHSGDIGHTDERGYFYIVDRLKDMIVVGGLKVFPAEVERVLLDLPSVSEAAVVGLPDSVLGERVVAFLSCPQQRPSLDEVLTACRPHLADYKLPSRIAYLDELPRNPAGKVLKQVLRQRGVDPVTASASAPAASIVPQAPAPPAGEATPWLLKQLENTHPASRLRMVTQLLQQHVQTLTGLGEPPDPDTTFMESGMDSLMIVELRDRLQVQIGPGLELSATMVFDYPKIADLAKHLVACLDAPPAELHAPPASLPPVRTAPPVEGEMGEDIEQMSDEQAMDALLRELDE